MRFTIPGMALAGLLPVVPTVVMVIEGLHGEVRCLTETNCLLQLPPPGHPYDVPDKGHQVPNLTGRNPITVTTSTADLHVVRNYGKPIKPL